MTSRRGAREPFAVLVFFTLFAGEAIRNTLSWYGFAAWTGILAVLSVVILIRVRPPVLGSAAPAKKPRLSNPLVWLGAFLLWLAASVAWSEYPLGTLLGLVVVAATNAGTLAARRVLDDGALVRALAVALGLILILSLAFEGVVGLLGRPILPVFPINVPPGATDLPDAFYWSRAELFEGGRIQGILGNSNLLGFVALLTGIVSACAWRAGILRRAPAIAGVTLGLLVLALTRSSTVLAATVAVIVVALLALAFRRGDQRSPARWRAAAGWTVLAAVAAGAAAATVFSRPLLAALGKSPDLTGRLDIWSAVTELVLQRPVAGWGWTGYWQPWIPVFEGLATRRGVEYLQAHNAFLDIALQLGAIGLILFAGVIVAVVMRAIRSADRTLLPLLLITALVVQALAESRLLVEGNWSLLVLLALGSLAASGSPVWRPVGRPGHPASTPRQAR